MTAPANLIYDLPSILDRINLSALFAKSQPLEVELGCGDASFLANYAKAHPEHNFLGVERLLGRLKKLDRKGRRENLQNLRGLRVESAYFLEYLLPPHTVTALHLYFPDPWPKRKHQRHRIVNERYPQLAAQTLVPGGIVYLRTDHVEYFEQMQSVFAVANQFRPIATPPGLSAILTDFETDFIAQGIQTNHAAYQLC
ncbi:MAG TPA: tRNA (guanosine(46)-N7)-methyltransferase TrmB [Verrucomicrobiae bacterium]|nr:tRNA (guanosine(46)-N7)-methyltransferase TrmB [Verrucomicrobiae bacterium]